MKYLPWVVMMLIGIAMEVGLAVVGAPKATPLTDLNNTLKELDKEIIEVLPEVEEVVKGCVVRKADDGIGPERTLVLCRI